MNLPKVSEYDYINFLIAAHKASSCSEAERVQPESGKAAHDAIPRLLDRMEPSSDQLWQEAQLISSVQRHRQHCHAAW